ncbi:MAG: bifunctional DNA-formamidopyrimidine glycosylase/DNA-(apurinic or apyrimidinic site) lyase [Alphaproteobacteria bacterium]|nr:bifunctional DNA-formamidopyrimidine glycosylase/DNA-(apurinic or apyrimidinic site) lyase [Alphaproteobacteria bacterium]
MPELPEVETVRQGLIRCMVGHRLAKVDQRRADLRFPLPRDFARRLTGRTVTAIDRRAKYLLLHLDDGMVLMIHLGMSGRIVVGRRGGVGNKLGEFHHETVRSDSGGRDAHDHVVFTTDHGFVVTFNDPRRFGMMDLVSNNALHEHKLLKSLGPEPLEDAFDAQALAARLRGKRTPIKAAILDQNLVVGVGNIYACEALFRAGISPRRLAGTVKGERAERLVKSIKDVLRAAIKAGGSSLRDYVQADGELGYFQHHFQVYDREGSACPKCGQKIKRLAQGGRSTFYCAKCQR